MVVKQALNMTFYVIAKHGQISSTKEVVAPVHVEENAYLR